MVLTEAEVTNAMELTRVEVTNAIALIKQAEESKTRVLTKQVKLMEAVVLKQSEVTMDMALTEVINATALIE